MIRSIRTAITHLIEELTIRLTKPSAKPFGYHDERNFAATKKCAIQPTIQPIIATSLKLDKALVEHNPSWSESCSANQSNHNYSKPESTSPDGTHDRKSPPDTLAYTNSILATVAKPREKTIT